MVFANLVNQFDAAAKKVSPENSGDYYVDEILHCGKCNTPKESVFDVPLVGVRKVRHLCKCGEAAFQAEREAERKEQERIRINQLRSAGLHDKALANMTFENDNGCNVNMKTARKFVDNWKEIKEKNMSAIFMSGVGRGKTFVAACIANALIKRGVPTLMTTSSRLIDKAMGFDAQYDFINEMREYDLLIIDDFGAERTTEYALQKLFDVIDARVKQNKPMILTTNLTMEEMKRPENLTYERIFSRVMGVCVPIVFEGRDLRKAQGAEKIRQGLGLFAD